MRKLAKPIDRASDVFRTCIGQVADLKLKAKLTAITPLVASAANEFDKAAKVAATYKLRPETTVGSNVTSKEMSAVYRIRMAKKGAAGRNYYEELLDFPTKLCPLCGQRTASTLDHYLPHTKFPALAVALTNLVPACFDCNKLKSDAVPKSAGEQTLHPYFDDFEQERWLYAAVIETAPAALRFFVQSPCRWRAVRKVRVQHHFDVFKLGQLYASNGAQEMRIIRLQLERIHRVAGPSEVREHLIERARSSEAVHLNSWHSATYSALADSDWYVSGGFAEDS